MKSRLIIINLFISFGLLASSCSMTGLRSPSSLSETSSCLSTIKKFFTTDEPLYVEAKDLNQLENIDEELFERLKLKRLEDLKEGRVRESYDGALDKIAHLEAIVEHRMKYPIHSGFQENYRKLSEKKIKRLTKVLEGVDLNSDWTYSKYRKFIFKYYSIMNTEKGVALNYDAFSVATKDFIIKRTEQQILMNHIAPHISVVSRLKNRTKLILSLLSNITMLHNVGTFYTFYELRIFTPSDEIIEKIYKEGLLPNIDELMQAYKTRSAVELTYNQMRPYLVVTGLATTAIAIGNAYQNGERIVENTIDQYEKLIESIIEKFTDILTPEQRKKLLASLEKEARSDNRLDTRDYELILKALSE
ncbi:hypothetical protein [Halobacteriovorax marinus]|uniref:hypothetical protein n=1 Tax=Halobacteriovorax marinus TaxID=97084 RepID=UPI003A948458